MKRSKHSLSHYHLTSCNMGQLIPIGLMEVLPGDTVQHATSLLVRVAPLLAPVMHPVHVRIHHWFVPHRLVWSSWEDFITGGASGTNASVFPTINNSGGAWGANTLADYLGVAPGPVGLPVSALPFRGYALIFNEWYRDEQLVSPLTVSTGDGNDSTTNLAVQSVAWEKDYFTTCRPTPQLGPTVSLPLGTSATVKRTTGLSAQARVFKSSDDSAFASTSPLASDGSAGLIGAGGVGAYLDPNGTLYADLSTATAATVTALRQALAIQRYEEARARYGSRYTEYLRYLGVRSSDARLQRPEYLGGGKQTIQFSEVLQTSPTTSGTPVTGVGAMQGHGIGAVRSNRYRRFFEEHGYVFSLLSVLPKTIYTQSIARHWNRAAKEDFWQKELERIGMQSVLNKEVYANQSSPNGVFGYQDRYDEYRRIESRVSGDFRSATLNYWHLGRVFAGDVALNSTFVTSNPSTRIFQATSSEQLYIMGMHSIQARRLVAKLGTPAVM